MWKEINLDGNKYFIHCQIEKNEVEFILYDLKQSWCEKQNLSVILKRVKDLNKRIKYDDEIVCNTLQYDKPVLAIWEQCNTDSTLDMNNPELAVVEKAVKLKYKIISCPFNFVWYLQKHSEDELKKVLMVPLFDVVQGLIDQTAELRKIIYEKDIEIKQYKTEGAVLKRTTVATQPFDYSSFGTKFGTINANAESLKVMGEHLRAIIKQSKPNEQNVDEVRKPEENSKVAEQQNSSPQKNFKNGERNRKRRAKELQQCHLADKLIAQKKKLEYESSQSQSQSQNLSEEENQSKKKISNISQNPLNSGENIQDSGEVIQETQLIPEQLLQQKQLKKINFTTELPTGSCLKDTSADLTMEISVAKETLNPTDCEEIDQDNDEIIQESQPTFDYEQEAIEYDFSEELPKMSFLLETSPTLDINISEEIENIQKALNSLEEARLADMETRRLRSHTKSS